MKKRLQWIMLPAAVIILAALVFTFEACKSPIERYEHAISELRDNIYIAENDHYSVQIITGKREDPFVMDGHAGGVRDFTVVTLDPKAGAGDYSYRVTVNGTEYAGAFIPHPFARTYSADIEVLSADSEIALTVTSGPNSDDLTAKSVKTDNMITASKAVEIADKKLKNRIEGFRSGNVLSCEVYVRLIANPVDNSGGYHWYVAFIGENQAIYAVLIEPVSMQVVAIRD